MKRLLQLLVLLLIIQSCGNDNCGCEGDHIYSFSSQNLIEGTLFRTSDGILVNPNGPLRINYTDPEQGGIKSLRICNEEILGDLPDPKSTLLKINFSGAVRQICNPNEFRIVFGIDVSGWITITRVE